MPWAAAMRRARPGDVLKVDVGCLIDGYTSDTGPDLRPRPLRDLCESLALAWL
jgi:hypothetical protein